MPKWGMFIDLDKCAACQACTVACKVENNAPFGVNRNEVLTINVTDGAHATVRQQFIPRPCMHCDNAPCTKVCPVQATYRREDGVVMQDMNKCIGCKYCINACPYGARYYQKKTEPFDDQNLPNNNPDAPQPQWQTVNKCTFCHHRLDKGNNTPACVQICPAKARYFGDLDDPGSEINQVIRERKGFVLRPDQKTKPKIYYGAEG